MSVRVNVDFALNPTAAFDAFIEELVTALSVAGLRFEVGPNGRILQGETELGHVVSWLPGKSVVFEWWRPDWKANASSKVEFRFEPTSNGTRVKVEVLGWEGLLDDQGGELAGWFAGQVVGLLLAAMGQARFGDWLTDRRARKPAGLMARETYRNPIYHRPNFLAILKELSLQPNDYPLEVGCGGGAFLHDALQSGCKAAVVDHSHDMVKLAREVNRDAIAAGRLEVLDGEAERLPYPDGKFTCTVTTGVFGFLTDPVRVLTELHRVLSPGGRMVVFAGTKELRGTPAAPEPIASRLHFYEDTELEHLARQAGFLDIRVDRPNLEPYARQAGVPAEHVALFSLPNSQLLIARKR